MSFFSGIKKITKPFINLDIAKWIGYRQLVKSSHWVSVLVKRFFIPEQAKTQESFSQALCRLKLTESDLTQRLKEFKRLMWIWIFLFFVSVAYSVYLFREHALRGFFPCVAICIIILTQVFRYHFWAFQIQQRRLGCGFYDWLGHQFTFRNKNNEKVSSK